jgi:hypothetical protein
MPEPKSLFRCTHALGVISRPATGQANVSKERETKIYLTFCDVNCIRCRARFSVELGGTMTGGMGRNQKPGPVVRVPKQRLNRISDLLTIHTFGGRGSPPCPIFPERTSLGRLDAR